MAASNLENQLQSAQKNLQFLQREHASTLKGLHAEIRRLQQHCTGTRAARPRSLGASFCAQDGVTVSDFSSETAAKKPSTGLQSG